MSLRLSYTLLAPFYDLFVGPASRAARRESLAALPRDGHRTVLVNGVGSSTLRSCRKAMPMLASI
jgi:hypothetical protein